jgi:hypothetical protein
MSAETASLKPTLTEVLALLLQVTTREELKAVYATFVFDEIAPTSEEKAVLTNAAIAASARCWARRWPEDCCD